MLLNKCSSTREPMETSAWVLTSLDSRTDKNCNGKKCLLSMLFINAVFIIVFFWYENKPIRWHYESRLRCRQEPRNTTEDISPLNLSTEVAIGRMLYDKPQIFKPPRSDVLMVTPWLAPIIWNGSYNIDILNAQFHQRNVRVGITVFAMKKYTVFIKTFIETAEQFFMVGHKVNYYVFTDRADDISNFTLPEGRQLVILEVPSYKQWQEVSMRRMEMIRDKANQRFYKEVDYLVCVDVDMRFSDFVGVEILSDVFGTIHPGFYNAQRGSFTYERRQKSTAYIPTDEGDFYYAGGYFGGTVEEVYKLTNFCHKAIMTDKHNSIEAIWHDESHLNKYFLYHKPTRILSPEYLWDNNFGVPQFLKRRRFVAVPKNHNEIRNKRAL
ncbi:histo-blood group ABO system transferase-like isoform X1 [Rana temporaria]|uniref:histo-blood group ABO system transferase-like isoform X1 n=1 Tax=Rana temporaria TaxID=8407 RepID=UPI001AAC70F1|nr:histo-blood group ABO system transferase-like isoform X1 [Rana temporaria]